MKKKYHLGLYLTTNEWDAWRFCLSRNVEASPYARKRYPAHYKQKIISDDNPWIGFICWYYYRASNDGGERNV